MDVWVWGQHTRFVFRKLIKSIYTKAKLGMFRQRDISNLSISATTLQQLFLCVPRHDWYKVVALYIYSVWSGPVSVPLEEAWIWWINWWTAKILFRLPRLLIWDLAVFFFLWLMHMCHKLWTKISKIRQNFKGNLTSFCEIFLNITLELPQYSLKPFLFM